MAANVKTYQTTCVLDCPDTCTLEVDVRDGVIERIRGGGDHPVTDGFICSKVAGFGKRVHHPARLLHPMRRRGAKGEGRFVRITWEEAIAEITGRFRAILDAFGGEAILPFDYGGSNGFLTEELVDSIFFARLGASRLAKTICAAPTTEVALGMYGKMGGVAFEDYSEAKLIVIWGANPRVSNIHLVPFLKEAKRRGAVLVTVDPRRNFSPELVDLHLPVYPGADLPLALGLIRLWAHAGALDRDFLARHAVGLDPLLEAAEPWTIEKTAAETGVSAADIERLADLYARTSPAVVRCGWGLERNRNGGQAVAAILAMPALLGKFGVRGGGYTLSNSGAGGLDASRIWDESSWSTRILNMTEIGRLLNDALSPPLKALFVYNCNPVASVPDQRAVIRGLEREDLFTVVFEQVMTDSALYADVLLPATTFLEHHDIKRSYGSYVVGATQPVIAPPGEARTNLEVFGVLGRAMGFTDEAFSWSSEVAFDKVVSALRLHGRAIEDRSRLASGKVQRYTFPGSTPVQLDTVRPTTPDGKIHLTPEALGSTPYRYRPVGATRYPLAMISPATSKSINSTLAEAHGDELRLTLHPLDAAARSLTTGDTVRVFNDQGEVRCRVTVSDRVREGVVVMPKGTWRKSSLNGLTATALAPAHVNEVGGGACFNDARVDVELVAADTL